MGAFQQPRAWGEGGKRVSGGPAVRRFRRAPLLPPGSCAEADLGLRAVVCDAEAYEQSVTRITFVIVMATLVSALIVMAWVILLRMMRKSAMHKVAEVTLVQAKQAHEDVMGCVLRLARFWWCWRGLRVRSEVGVDSGV